MLLYMCRLADAGAARDLGAHAVALGLARDSAAIPLLVEELEETSAEAARSHLALALGMTGATGSADELFRLVEESTYRPTLLAEAATALGLLRDARAVPVLAEKLGEARSLAAQAAIATALGRVGDARAVDPLLELLTDSRRTDSARAFAAAALGAVVDDDRLPWSSPLKAGSNPLALPATLYDASGFGVLNLL
ncbi:MAG: HEAT repeat domain-containing protein, partial [Planctomycetota bacterium]